MRLSVIIQAIALSQAATIYKRQDYSSPNAYYDMSLEDVIPSSSFLGPPMGMSDGDMLSGDLSDMYGISPDMSLDTSGMYGIPAGMSGDPSRMYGIPTGMSGDLSGMYGIPVGMSGDPSGMSEGPPGMYGIPAGMSGDLSGTYGIHPDMSGIQSGMYGIPSGISGRPFSTSQNTVMGLYGNPAMGFGGSQTIGNVPMV